jgi:hypothetical protein
MLNTFPPKVVSKTNNLKVYQHEILTPAGQKVPLDPEPTWERLKTTMRGVSLQVKGRSEVRAHLKVRKYLLTQCLGGLLEASLSEVSLQVDKAEVVPFSKVRKCTLT